MHWIKANSSCAYIRVSGNVNPAAGSRMKGWIARFPAGENRRTAEGHTSFRPIRGQNERKMETFRVGGLGILRYGDRAKSVPAADFKDGDYENSHHTQHTNYAHRHPWEITDWLIVNRENSIF